MEVLKKRIKDNYHYIVSALAVVGIAFAAMNFTNPPLFNNLDQFVIFASEEIKLEQEVQVSSGDLGSNRKIDIEKESIINGNLFADKITLDKNTVINGNVSFNQLETKKETKILGTQIKPVQLPIANLPEIPAFQIGTQDFKFEGQNNTLAAGNYRNLIVEKNSRLTLSGGAYNFNKLVLKENSVLIFSALTTLNIQFKLKGQEHVAVLPGNNNLKPIDLIINYQGKSEKGDEDDKDKSGREEKSEGVKPIEFGKNSFLNFKLLAPKASVHIGGASTIRGRILARKVRVEKGGVVSRELMTIKVAKPEDIITDPGGGVYPINEILVSLTPTATISDAQKIASSIGGKIVSIIPPTLYKIEIRTKTIKELEDKLDALRNSNNPLITGIFRNFVMLENTGYPFNRSTYLSKVDQTLYSALLSIFTNQKRILIIVLMLLSSILLIYYKKDLLTKTLKTIYNKLFYDEKHFKLFVILSALSTIVSVYFVGLLAWLFFGWTLSSLREVIVSLFSFPTIIQALGIPFETFVFATGFIGYNQGVFGSAYSISFFSYSVLGFVGNIIFFYSVLFLIRYVKKNLQHRMKSIPAAFMIIFLLLFGTYVGLVRYVREAATYMPSPINRIESFIHRVNAQLAVKYDLQNLKNQNVHLTRAYDKIGILDAWDKINNLQNLLLTPIVIGIVDTGTDRAHQEFNNPEVDLGLLRNILRDLREPRGHGTQVAGIIGANNVLGSGGILAANSPQMNGILSGVLAEDKYKLEVRSSGSFVTNTTSTLEDVYVALKKVAASDAQLINMSFVLERCSDLSFVVRNFIVEKCAKTNQEWTYADAEFQGVFNSNLTKLFIAAAGNEDANFVFATPAHWSILMPNVISVGASDLVDERANFPFPAAKSNFGVELNISAPGIGVYAPKPGGGYDVPFLDNGVIKGGFSGTSASAPMVTGVAGLIKAIKPNLSPADIKSILVRTADPIQTDQPIGGRLNALKAVCDPLVLNCAPTPPPQPSNTWQSVGPMTTERADHTATLLNDGRVLIAGGFKGIGTSFTVLDSAEIFNPVINSFASVSNMTTVRAFHTATLLSNGKVLIVGGVGADGSTALNTAEIFDPATNTFSPVGNLNSKRFFHTANLLPDNRVLIAGGFDSLNLKSTEIFDPVANQFSVGPDMNMPRTHHASTSLIDGRIFLVNGLILGSIMSVDIYNPSANIFTSATSSAEQLGLSVNTLLSGKVSILGGKLFNQPNGQTAEIFDPADNSFVEIGPMLISGIARDSAVLLNSGQVLFIGTNIKAQIFNPQTNEFKLTGDLNTLRFIRHRLTLLQDSRALLTGGQLSEISFITTNGAEVYKP